MAVLALHMFVLGVSQAIVMTNIAMQAAYFFSIFTAMAWGRDRRATVLATTGIVIFMFGWVAVQLSVGSMADRLGVGLGPGHSSHGALFGPMVGVVAGASGWFLLFFLLGFFVVACMFAVAGAIASRSEDVQSTAQPVIMLVVTVLIVGMSLSGTAQVVASYVPVVSTVTMPARIMDGSAAWWEPIVAIVVALVAAVVITRAATRLYTRSIMQTGGRLSYREAFRLKA